jgi:hypothetical protein
MLRRLPIDCIERVGALVAFAACSGCLAIPPMQATIGPAYSGGGERAPLPTLQISGVARPLGLFRELGGRRFDVGVGVFGHYRAQTLEGPLGPGIVGPTLEFDAYPDVEGDTDGQLRLTTGVALRGLYDEAHDAWGAAAGYRLGLEAATFASGCGGEASQSGIFVACGEGELGIGAYGDATFGYVDGHAQYAFGLSLGLRIPGSIVGGVPFDW